MDFSDKIVLITGASSGIGAATAKYLTELGASVVLIGRNEENLNKVGAQCEAVGKQKPLLLVADVTKTEDNQRVIDEIIKEYGKLDVLVNNAGIGKYAGIETTSLEQYDDIMQTNMRAVYHLTMLAVPHLIKSKGNIVNISSIAGTRAFANVLAYCVSKAALDQFTRCVALDLASKQIRVNSVNPAVIVTDFHNRLGMSPTDYATYLKNCEKSHPLGRVGQPSEVAAAIAFLAADNASSFITGTCIVTKSESRDFMAVFPDLVRDLTEYAKKYDNTLAPKWFVRALQYNVPQGKKNRGLAAVLAYRMLSKSEDLTPENIRRAHYLGWVIEMFQSVFLICDDAMDGSQTRRGQPCWYKLEDVKLSGINDALMIDAAIYYVLKKQFGDEPYYTKLVELFNEIKFITTIGQSLDLRSARMDVTKYTMDLYKSIVCHKTAYYTFYLPVALAMHMTGFTDPEVFRQTKTILLEIGLFFQTQDDFLDCFGDPAVTGKIGTDIEEGKCTWLSVVAMQRASDEQKELMKQCYGSSDPEKVARVKKLYEELGLPTTYAIYEEESYNMIKTHIQQISRGLPHELFFKIMEKIYRRDC